MGTHNAKRSSYGHAMIVDPWGVVIGQCGDGVGIAIAQIDFQYLKSVRQKLPVWSDRRPQLYGNIISANDFENLESDTSFQFGPSAVVTNFQVFYKTRHSIAFVNHRPILSGHVLVSVIREAKRLQNLSSEEVSDLFLTVQRVQNAIEKEYGASSTTIAIQDGPDAGQSIAHLHVHIIPRKPTDFEGRIDQLYLELQKHDKQQHKEKYRLRTDEEMSNEANRLKKYFI